MAVRSVLVRLQANIGQFTGAMSRAGSSTRDLARDVSRAREQNQQFFDDMGAAAAVAGTAMLVGVGAAVKATMAFDKELSSAGAALSATSGQMLELREAALEAGKSTVYSATESAEAITELAKAGLSAQEIVGGGLDGALNLAAAGMMDVGEAAEIGASAMTQFNLEGSDLEHIADLLASGANAAQGSVKDLGDALNQSGLVANQFGLSVEETVGALASFASSGMTGSDAGTSFKSMLIRLTAPTKEAAELMKELGIATYDSGGEFVGLANFSGQLKDSLSKLTPEQRNAALATMFGSDAIRAATVLYQEGAVGVNEWIQTVDKSGAAADIAAKNMDNLAGDVEMLKGSFETLLIQSGSSVSGLLRGMTQGVTEALDSFSQLPPVVSTVVTGFLILGGGALVLVPALMRVNAAITSTAASLAAIGPAGAKASAALLALQRAALPIAAIFAAIGIVGTTLEAFEPAAARADKLTDSIIRFSRESRVGAEMGRVFGGNLERLYGDLYRLNNDGFAGAANSFSSMLELIPGVTGIYESFNASVLKSRERMEELDEAIAKTYASGNKKEALDFYEEVKGRARDANLSEEELADAFKQTNDAIGQSEKKKKDAVEATTLLTGSEKSHASALAAVIAEYGTLSDALEEYNGTAQAGEKATLDWINGLVDLKATMTENRGELSLYTAAGRTNREAMLDQIDTAEASMQAEYDLNAARYGEAEATVIAARRHGEFRKALIDTAVQSGASRKAATEYIDELFRIPSERKTKVTAPGATSSTAEIAVLQAKIKELKDKTVKIKEEGAVWAAEAVSNLWAQIKRLEDKEFQIKYNIEYNQDFIGPIQPRRWGGVNVQPAATGLVNATIAAPRTVYQWAEPETGGEAFIPRKGNAQRSRGILDVAASWYGGQVVYSDSKPVAAPMVQQSITAEVYIGGQKIDERIQVRLRQHDEYTSRQADYGGN